MDLMFKISIINWKNHRSIKLISWTVGIKGKNKKYSRKGTKIQLNINI